MLRPVKMGIFGLETWRRMEAILPRRRFVPCHMDRKVPEKAQFFTAGTKLPMTHEKLQHDPLG